MIRSSAGAIIGSRQQAGTRADYRGRRGWRETSYRLAMRSGVQVSLIWWGNLHGFHVQAVRAWRLILVEDGLFSTVIQKRPPARASGGPPNAGTLRPFRASIRSQAAARVRNRGIPGVREVAVGARCRDDRTEAAGVSAVRHDRGRRHIRRMQQSLKEGLINEPQLHAVPHSSEGACDSSKG